MRLPKLTLAIVLLDLGGGAASAATLSWKGHTWQVTSGGMAGVCQGDPKNVTVDGDGFLHLRIANSGGAWTSSELFTTDRLGFGTYQWQVDGPIDTYDKNVVLGLFPYGPAAGLGGDGTNEIDIEYSRWGQANGPNGDWTDYPASGNTVGELSYTFSLGGTTLSTSRFTWSSTAITDALLKGLQPVDGSTAVLKTWTYAPPTPSMNIPQQPLPLGMNLWCFDAPPSDGSPVEIVIRDFVFVPAGAGAAGGAGGRPPGGGGAGGASPGSGGAGGGSIGGAGTGGGTGAGAGGATGGATGPGTGGASVGSGGRPVGASGGSGDAAGHDGSGGRTSSAGGAASGGEPGGSAGAAGRPATSSGGTGQSAGSGGGGGASAGSTAGGGASSGCSCQSDPAGSAASFGALLLVAAVVAAAFRPRRTPPS